MASFRAFTNFANIKDIGELVKYVSQAFLELQGLLNGKLEFDKNILSQTVSVKFDQANVDKFVAHNLGKNGVNYIVVKKSAAADIYTGSATNSTNTLYLKSTVANVTVTLVLF